MADKFGNNTRNQGNRSDENQRWLDEFKRRINTDYKRSWISNAADPDMVEFAKYVGKSTAEKGLTNSKIRNIYGEIMRIKSGGFESHMPDFYLLKPKLAYILGRADSKDKVGIEAFKEVFDRAWDNVAEAKNEKSFLNFCNLMEATLAYHKAHGGK